ncbi:DUF2948 family protein [Propylenella binzhouense]|uniref:DUF2948 family protein n=1 Tax=Propylenella binzhouense TaxID=2555902 RepID=A0A964T1S5_9HYPH|nr:DUF2948 family protein [Propylenella binzhouense]MYZ46813.1 DUF2948 family protein [Propylenella binzhouense]
MSEAERLRLIALDADDLDVVSAFLQDAVLRAGDVRWLPRERRFALAFQRFPWESAGEKGFLQRMTQPRKLAALHFERVEKATCMGFDPARADRMLTLLSIRFDEKDPPSGDVFLIFSAKAAIRLSVECIEAQLCDLDEAGEAEPASAAQKAL